MNGYGIYFTLLIERYNKRKAVYDSSRPGSELWKLMTFLFCILNFYHLFILYVILPPWFKVRGPALLGNTYILCYLSKLLGLVLTEISKPKGGVWIGYDQF